MARSFARIVLAVACLCLAAAALAKPLDPVKPPPPDQEVLRQGGDTFADAVLIPDFYSTTGTTTGYTHDYDEVCPYSGSTSPDVVYRVTPDYWMFVDIDLYGSDYDTKVYVYGAGMELIACNDDYYADYTSRIEGVELLPGVKYFVVIDGYGGDHGTYEFFIGVPPPNRFDRPHGDREKGEPPMVVRERAWTAMKALFD